VATGGDPHPGATGPDRPVKLGRARCLQLLEGSERGTLATMHPERGVDAVPACFAVAGDDLVVPVDRVKPKSSVQLTRTGNLDRDPRAVLLCDHWDGDDWSMLWWVRAWLQRRTVEVGERAHLESLLGAKYAQYAEHPFADLLVFRITGVSGWSASPR
jgi:hypothetical protein